MEQLDAFGKIGAPYDLYHEADLKEMRPYKLYIFWNLFLTDQQERGEIHRVLKENNATALWIYAPGFVSMDKGKNIDTMKELTGIKFASDEIMQPLCVKITNPFHPVSKDFYSKEIGLKQNLPLFYTDDSDVTVLGRSVLTNKPVFVIKELPGWTSIHIGAYPVPPSLFRSIASYAGVHIYNNQDDALAVNESYFSIHSTVLGERTITLPAKSDVYDLFKQEYIAKNTCQFKVSLNAPETLLFKISRVSE